MNEDKATRYNRLLPGLVACLLLIAAVQGYYLFRVHHQLNQNVAYASDRKTSGQEWHAAPPAPDPADSLLDTPFDPNSWNPFTEMEEMHKQMDRIFEQAFGRFGASPRFHGFLDGFTFSPKSDVEENEAEYIVRLDIPGTDSSKINVKLEDRTLHISGVREEDVTHPGANKHLRNERRLGKFERMMTLPGPVKQDGLKANYKDGVLTITIPKDTASQGGKTIPIQ